MNVSWLDQVNTRCWIEMKELTCQVLQLANGSTLLKIFKDETVGQSNPRVIGVAAQSTKQDGGTKMNVSWLDQVNTRCWIEKKLTYLPGPLIGKWK
jgi:hypothetical protein